MTIDQLKNQLPDYAKDIKLNLSTLFNTETKQDLTIQQVFLIALASAYTCKEPTIIHNLSILAKSYLDTQQINAAKSAATIMAMNNIYYRFTHLTSDKTFASMPAKLRMNVIANPGIDKIDFELACLAVSSINGCGLCMDAHAKELSKSGISLLAIQSTVKLAAVIHATALAFTIEQTLSN